MYKQRFDLSGKLALVTGASRGIGEATALALAEAGADVVLSSRKVPDLEVVAEKIKALGRAAHPIGCNFGVASEIEALCQRLAEEGLHPDILVNNAATNPTMSNLLDVPEEVWRKILDVNLSGPLRLCRGVVPLMRKSGGGVIVNVASIGGIRPPPFLGAYGVSKAALIFLTKVLASELAREKIRVNAVAPGLVKTRFARALFENEMIYKSAVAGIRLGRHGEPEEIASVIALLCSPASSFMTGEVVVVDGGATLG